jgi:hypothetical protein
MSSTDVDAAPGSGRAGRREVLPTLIPILLAALGLTAALIAWRAGDAISQADDANRAGLDAARARSAATVVNESLTTRTLEAFLDYERARRRAAALAAANLEEDAQLDRMIATAHWFLVEAAFIDRDGNFQPDAQREALMADAVQDADLDPAPHFAAAEKAWTTLSGLILAAIVMAVALPFLTLAQVTTGRLRIVGTLIGSVTMAAGIALMAVA